MAPTRTTTNQRSNPLDLKFLFFPARTQDTSNSLHRSNILCNPPPCKAVWFSAFFFRRRPISEAPNLIFANIPLLSAARIARKRI